MIGPSIFSYTTEPIHTSLTRIDASAVPAAVRVSKQIMGWMGDRSYTYPDTLAQDVVDLGLSGGHPLRDEVRPYSPYEPL